MNSFEYKFDDFSVYYGIANSLKLIYNTFCPVIICVGSDLAVGDSLGPIIGSELKDKLQGKAYVYGSLDAPITAKEIKTIYNTINNLHPKSKILVIDAAVGNKEDLGNIKIKDEGIKPGEGINKDLEKIGDVSIIGIVSDKTRSKEAIYNETRFALIKKMSNVIIKGILEYFK